MGTSPYRINRKDSHSMKRALVLAAALLVIGCEPPNQPSDGAVVTTGTAVSSMVVRDAHTGRCLSIKAHGGPLNQYAWTEIVVVNEAECSR